MNSKGNPILMEMAEQLPQASKLFQIITTGSDYSRIVGQARQDFYCFADLDKKKDSEVAGLAILKKNGYESWLDNMEEEDRLRICGVLQMIADLAQDLDEE